VRYKKVDISKDSESAARVETTMVLESLSRSGTLCDRRVVVGSMLARLLMYWKSLHNITSSAWEMLLVHFQCLGRFTLRLNSLPYFQHHLGSHNLRNRQQQYIQSNISIFFRTSSTEEVAEMIRA